MADMTWDGLRELPLSNGGNTIIDRNDMERVMSAGRWFKVKKSSGYYACRSFGRDNRVYLHRFIVGAPDGLVVDHINGDTLDNRQENLRAVTHQKNQRNRAGPQNNGTSGVLGVSWHKQRSKWNARIGHNGKKIHLGLYDKLEDAVRARRQAEASLWSRNDTFRQRANHAGNILEK